MVKTLKFYGENENSVKKIIITILGNRWPLTTRDIHQKIKDDFGIRISYQATHKAIKELLESEIVSVHERRYELNKHWIKSTSDFFERLRSNYEVNQDQKRLNSVLIKNYALVDNMRREEVNNHLKRFIPICKKAFKKHNIFNKETSEIQEYLLKLQREHAIIIFRIEKKVVGGVIIVKEDIDESNSFARWRLKHFAHDKSLPEKTTLRFMKEVERSLPKKYHTTKINYNLAESEEDYIKLFKRAGFHKESTIKDKYRFGEKAFIYSKVIHKR